MTKAEMLEIAENCGLAPLQRELDIIFVVRFGNYEPTEADSLWSTKELAERRAEQLGGQWCVKSWPVHREWVDLEV